MSDGLILIRKYLSDFDAQLAKARLDAEGIPSAVISDDAGGMLPQFQMVEGVRLMVREDDLERAQEILDEGEADSP